MLENKHLSDDELIRNLNSGSEAAFTEIYERYWEKMVDYAVRLTKSEEEAGDIVQEIFISVWNRRHEIYVTGSLVAYLIKSTRNLSLRYIQKNINTGTFLEKLSKNMQNALTAFDDRLSLQDLQLQIDKAVDSLPSKMKTVYLLSRDEQLSYRQIAEKMGITENTVKNQIHNALKSISSSIKSKYSVSYIIFFLHFLK